MYFLRIKLKLMARILTMTYRYIMRRSEYISSHSDRRTCVLHCLDEPDRQGPCCNLVLYEDQCVIWLLFFV
jgi:hypothetical protein